MPRLTIARTASVGKRTAYEKNGVEKGYIPLLAMPLRMYLNWAKMRSRCAQ